MKYQEVKRADEPLNDNFGVLQRTTGSSNQRKQSRSASLMFLLKVCEI